MAETHTLLWVPVLVHKVAKILKIVAILQRDGMGAFYCQLPA